MFERAFSLQSHSLDYPCTNYSLAAGLTSNPMPSAPLSFVKERASRGTKRLKADCPALARPCTVLWLLDLLLYTRA